MVNYLFCNKISEPNKFSNTVSAVSEIASSLDNTRLLNWSGKIRPNVGSNEIDLDILLRDAATTKPTPNCKVAFNDKLLYIYTSGTTGLPKAAVITHCRYLSIKHTTTENHSYIIYIYNTLRKSIH